MAQRGFSGVHGGARFAGGFGSHAGRYWGGYPFGALYGDSLFSDYDLGAGYAPAPPPVVVIQQPAVTDAPAAQASSPAQSLLIELRGGRYIRIRDEASSDAEAVGQQPVMSAPSSNVSQATQGRVAMPSTILVFRNGSQQEITGYTIADGVLYAQANYYTDGSWNKKISLSSLNVAETVSANRARGVRFQLPTASNEVIVGP